MLLKSIQILLFMALVNSPAAFAQLGFCPGNSGIPVFNEDFGTGTTDGPQLPNGITTYQYVGSATPYDGQYTISSTINYFDWHITPDHTPNDTDGKMFVVNADFTPDEFFRREINGLCEITSYEFSAWLINLLPEGSCDGIGIPNNVQFQIWDSTDTTVLASGDTGNIFGSSTPNWQQYGLGFQTLEGQSSIILKMLNNGIGGCGNDLAIDDIVFKSCGDNIELQNTSGANLFETCEDDMVTIVPLSAKPDFSVFSTHAYQWQKSTDNAVWIDIPGETNDTYNAPAPIPNGSLYYRVKFAETASNLQNSSCSSLSQSFEIKINALVTPTFNAVQPICSGDTLAPLPTTSLNSISGTWSPALNNTTTTTYTFTPNAGECATTQNLTIVVNQSITPTFDPVPAICSGDALSPLPTMSTNNISGTWSPALDNTATTTYTFTPAAGECPILSTLTITVNSKPTVDLDEVYEICSNTNGTELFQSSILSTDLSATDYSFEWTDASGNIVSTDSSYLPLEGGIYSVLVTDLITGCQNQDSTRVIESSPPTLELILRSNTFQGNGEIEVASNGTGIYEYSLDNGPWQDSPNFANVSAGNHIVTARDKNGCGFTSIDACLIGAPNFFTPNGDGINETWNLKGTTCLNYANIYIFDRFGKLLKEFDLNSAGWNGTFNGEYLQTNDYWYIIKYQETFSDTVKEHRGHFTLKR